MKIIKQSWEFEGPQLTGQEILQKIEKIGRTCYKSENMITSASAEKFVNSIIKSGHHSVIEHHNISVRIITDRGITHEIVRHRICSISQESTRYCNYSNAKFGSEITVILPVWFYGLVDSNFKLLGADESTSELEPNEIEFVQWRNACEASQEYYFMLLSLGQTAQEARSVLPNSLKTELVMTANLREWRHFFTLRASSKAHPQMQELAKSMLVGFKKYIPVMFADINPE